VPHPHLWQGEYLIWRRLKDYPASIQAACGSASNMETLLDNWAAGLLNRFDAMFRVVPDRTYLKRIADFALCAAKARSLRWKSYVRYALSQEPDRIRRTFDSFTHPEFPDVSWDAFLGVVKELREVLGVIAVATPAPAASSSVATAAPKVRNIAAVQPINFNGPGRL
jgi:hypothetical protein